MGPRPPAALLAAWIYALTGLVFLTGAIVGTVRFWRRQGLEGVLFSLPITLYCAALAYGTLRLRARSPSAATSPWVSATLVLHGLCGLLGATALLANEMGAPPLSFEQFASGAAMGGMLFGWAATFVPFVSASRAGVLMTAGLAGPVALALAIQLVPFHM